MNSFKCGFQMSEISPNEACPCCWTALTQEAQSEKIRSNLLSFIILLVAPFFFVSYLQFVMETGLTGACVGIVISALQLIPKDFRNSQRLNMLLVI